MKKLLEISSGGGTIIVGAPRGLVDAIINDPFLLEYIPAASLVVRESGVPDIELDVQSAFDLFKLPTGGVLGCRDLSTRDIISLLELVLERRRQEHGIDCIHSSCSIYRGRAIVFFGGASGMGKTRLMLELGSDAEAFCYSDEKTLLDLSQDTVVGGSSVAQITKPPMRRQLGRTKIDLHADDGGVYPLGLMVHAYVEDGGSVDYEFWDREKAEWHLYEELSRKIRANSRRVKDGEWPVDGLDSLELARMRISRIKSWLESGKVLYIRGTSKSITDKITELIDQKL